MGVSIRCVRGIVVEENTASVVFARCVSLLSLSAVVSHCSSDPSAWHSARKGRTSPSSDTMAESERQRMPVPKMKMRGLQLPERLGRCRCTACGSDERRRESKSPSEMKKKRGKMTRLPSRHSGSDVWQRASMSVS